ncbi:hypothetical protein SRHO_G00143050 [Serrasalmus rhombeus]
MTLGEVGGAGLGYRDTVLKDEPRLWEVLKNLHEATPHFDRIYIDPRSALHQISNLSDPPTMKLQVTLSLICVLLPKALTLTCNKCVPDLSGTCTDSQVACTDRCGSGTVLLNVVGVERTMRTKDCAAAAECVSGSLNLGAMKMTMNMQCCTSDRCNSQTPAALPFGSSNGKKCYMCIDNDCSGTVSCEGDQDRCISATATASGVQVAMKGCVSRNLCTDASSMQAAGVTGSVSCCEGNLCNGAEGVKLSLLIMLVPLIFSTLFT